MNPDPQATMTDWALKTFDVDWAIQVDWQLYSLIGGEILRIHPHDRMFVIHLSSCRREANCN